MSTVMGSEMEAVLGRLGRAWAWILAFGIISIAVGVLALVWPGPTLVAIAIVFAAQLVVSGIFRFVGAFAIPGDAGWLRALTALLAVLSFVVGLYLLGHVALSLLVLTIVLGVYWIAHGVVELFVSIGHGELHGRAWMIASGILSVVAGAIVVLLPGISLFALTLVLGVWLVVFGAAIVGRAVQLRSATRGLAPRPSGA